MQRCMHAAQTSATGVYRPRKPRGTALHQRVVPGFFFFIGCTPKDRDCKKADANHSPRFYVDESSLKLGVKSLATLAVDWLAANAR